MKKMRKLHLWIGLVTSVLILMESITGLLLMEPWLIGGEEHHRGGPGQEGGVRPERAMPSSEEAANAAFSAQRLIRGLHEGKLGDTDISWLVDLSAISMIILTVTGIYLSIRILRAERRRKEAR